MNEGGEILRITVSFLFTYRYQCIISFEEGCANKGVLKYKTKSFIVDTLFLKVHSNIFQMNLSIEISSFQFHDLFLFISLV